MSIRSFALVDRGPSIARRFGIRGMPANPALEDLPQLAAQVAPHLRPGKVILISGASGSGKSALLDHLERQLDSRARAIAVHRIFLPDAIAVDCFPQIDTEAALELLGRFGLGEVYTYLSLARKLSTGQQFRLRLAMAWAQTIACRAPRVLLCDEFATQLDPVSAGVLARLTRRQITADGRLCFVAASCHEAIAPALRPDLVVRCDFGQFSLFSEQAA